MRILAASDWHLGRLFHGAHLTEDQAFVLEQFLDLVKEIKADAVLVAGDIFDRAVPPPEAVELLDDILARLVLDQKVQTILIAGNHDSPVRLGFGSQIMAGTGLHVRGAFTGPDQPIFLEDEFGPLAVLPLPYADPAQVRHVLEGEGSFDQQTALEARLKSAPVANMRTIAMAHVFSAGGTASDSERPLSLGGVDTVDPNLFENFTFTLLGHLHRPQTAARDAILYPGSLLKYSFSEINDNKSVCMLEINGRGEVKTERIALTPRRDMRKIEGYFEEIMAGPGAGESKDDYLLVSLKDKGPIMDAMGRIREIYPNILHLERPFITSHDHHLNSPDDRRGLGDLELFRSFFQYAAGEDMTRQEENVLTESLSSFNRIEREY